MFMVRVCLSAGLAGTLVLGLTKPPVNPRDSAARMEQGLSAEAKGDLPSAERALTRAMETDRGLLPVWTLANYYLRHGDARYLPLLRKALGIGMAGSQDVTAIFDLAWQTGDDVAGDDAETLRLYVPYLIQAGHAEAVYRAARGVQDRELRLKAAQCLMDAGREDEFRKLTGAIAFNGDMNPPGDWSFDWKYNTAPDHAMTFQGAATGVRIDVSGGQPEQVDLLSERVAVTPGARYRLTWETKVEPGRARPRLRWVVAGKAVNAAESGWAPFTGTASAKLVLRLERALGEPPFAGTIWIRRPGIHAVGAE